MCMLNYVFLRFDRVIQYESRPVMNRLIMLPENQLTDIYVARPQYPRPKTSQVMASNGLVFYESVSSGGGTLTKWLMRLVDSNGSFWCAVCYYGDSKKINILAS